MSIPGTSVNVISVTIRISGYFDVALVNKSLNHLIKTDSSLRTRIKLENGQPHQYYADFWPENYPFYDFSLTDKQGFYHWEETSAKEPISVLDSPLVHGYIFKLSESEGGLLLKVHHLISDGWSTASIIEHFVKTYMEFTKGRILSSSPSSGGFQTETQDRYLQSKAYTRDKKYWDEILSRPFSDVSLKDFNGSVKSLAGRRKTFPLSKTLSRLVYAFCNEHRLSPFSVLYMALAVYLCRIKGAGRPCIGVPVVGRTDLEDKKATGMYVRTLPFICTVDDAWNFRDFSRHVSENWLELLKHQRFSFPEITRIFKRHNPGNEKLFNLVLSYQNSKIAQSSDESIIFTGRWHYSGFQAEQLCLHLNNREDEREFLISYDYLTQLFSEDDISKLHTHLTNILGEALENPAMPISRLSILSPAEKEQILYSFNDTKIEYGTKPLSAYLSYSYETLADKTALIQGGKRLSYAQLAMLSQSYAKAIREKCAGKKTTIAILLPKCFQLIAAMLGVLQSGNVFVLLPPDLPVGRLNELLEDSNPDAVISNVDLFKRTRLQQDCFIDIATIEPSFEPPQTCAPSAPGDAAYIVYTSGSSGKPKGTVLSYGNLLNFTLSMKEYFGHGAVLSLANTGFDVFILESVASLINGRTIILPTDEESESPLLLSKLIKNYAAGFIAITPSRLMAYMRQPEFAQALGSIDCIICGGEKITGSIINAIRRHTNANIYNQYGPSETTVGVSIKLLDQKGPVTAGKPMANCRIYVLDKNKLPLPTGADGDIYIGGACVGHGYLNAPPEVQQAFSDDPFEFGERIYKTGDTGCFTENGELQITGRHDAQVKINGQRVELSEISARMLTFPGVTSAVAKYFKTPSGGMLAAYYISPSALDESAIQAHLAVHLPAYMVPACITRLDAFPLGSSGKIDYGKLPAPQATGTYQLPESNIQIALLAIFKSVLGAEDLHINSDFFLSGGDSLQAISILAEIEKKFALRLKVNDIYTLRTVKQLAAHIDSSGLTPVKNTKKAPPKTTSFELTPIQQGIYLQSKLDPSGLAYNMPGAFLLPEGIDTAKLCNAFSGLVQAEPLLRTAFIMEGTAIRQVVKDTVPFELQTLTSIDLPAAQRDFLRPFDLALAPLMRAALWKSSEGKHYLLIDVHHIISDGLSANILISRLNELYSDRQLHSFSSYLDYAYYFEKAAKPSCTAYWQTALKGASPCHIPVDFKRPPVFDFRGSKHTFNIPNELTCKCDDYCRENSITPYVLFVGIFAMLLGKIARSEDILLGTPVSARQSAEEQQTFGPFIDTLPLRLRPANNTAIHEYFQEAKQQVSGLLGHQDIGREQLLELCGSEKSLDKNPLFSVLFSLRPESTTNLVLDGHTLSYSPIDTETAKFDLNLEASKQNGAYTFIFEYATSLFEASTIEFYGRCFSTILQSVLAGGATQLKDVAPLSASDKKALIDIPNRTFTPYLNIPPDMLIDDVAHEFPDAPAIIFKDETTTYHELIEKANVLAGFLQSKGVAHGDAIAFCLKRGVQTIVAMLGILKTGAAYVPMTASLPEERISYMLENSKAKLVLCDESTKQILPADICPMCDINFDDGSYPYKKPDARAEDSIMQILYTSGTTGKPKGVRLRVKSVANLLPEMERLTSHIDGNFICITTEIFDTFTTETLFTLCLGKTVVMADEEEMMLPWQIAGLIKKHNVKMIQFTPSRLQMCLSNEQFENSLQQVEFMLVCGEVFPLPLLEALRRASKARIVTMYGPTEVTIYMTYADVTDAKHMVIGRPMQNCRVYALDEAMQPVLPSAIGELYIGGECVSAGYAGREDLTRESFIEDPFFPGQVMYKTGDFGRLRLDGNYDFYGRRDHQVKLNGQRIELDEITGRLLCHDCVAEASTVATKKSDGSQYIHSYIVYKDGKKAPVNDILAYIKSKLPSFMVPSKITVLDELPRTESGKTDVLRLSSGIPENKNIPAAPMPAASNNPPITADQQTHTPFNIKHLWARVLETDNILPDVSFFEQGGTSLLALILLTHYFENGFELTMEQFYAAPTLNEQRALLFGINEPLPATEKIAAPAASFKDHTILLTGATGFLGAHLIQSLYCRGAQKIICPVRGSVERVSGVLSHYFGESSAKEYGNILEPISGDVEKPYLGIDPRRLPAVHYLIHAAADTRHYADDNRIADVNCKGTKYAIEIAKQTSARLLHISTISVCGEHIKNSPEKTTNFTENDFDIGQNWEENSYVKSKFLSERLVFEAMAEGLDAAIFRIGRLSGRSTDGKFLKNPQQNTFYSLVRGMQVLDCYPKSLAGMQIELSPIDNCADAILSLARSPRQVFHLVNPNQILFDDLAALAVPHIACVSDSEFEVHLKDKLKSGHIARLAVLIELYTRFKKTPAKITPVCALTLAELEKAGFTWKVPHLETLLHEFLT